MFAESLNMCKEHPKPCHIFILLVQTFQDDTRRHGAPEGHLPSHFPLLRILPGLASVRDILGAAVVDEKL